MTRSLRAARGICARGAATAAVLAIFLPFTGCESRARSPGPAPSGGGGPAWFVEVTREAGLDFVHEVGPTGSYFMPEVVGSGAAFLDFDGDGRLDIYLIQNAPGSTARNRLYRQEPRGRFTDVSRGSGLDVTGRGMGVAVGDVDNDSLPDVLLTEYGGARLFVNQGGG